jgi:hypothetical protein
LFAESLSEWVGLRAQQETFRVGLADLEFDDCRSVGFVWLALSVASIGGFGFRHCTPLSIAPFERNERLSEKERLD